MKVPREKQTGLMLYYKTITVIILSQNSITIFVRRRASSNWNNPNVLVRLIHTSHRRIYGRKCKIAQDLFGELHHGSRCSSLHCTMYRVDIGYTELTGPKQPKSSSTLPSDGGPPPEENGSIGQSHSGNNHGQSSGTASPRFPDPGFYLNMGQWIVNLGPVIITVLSFYFW